MKNALKSIRPFIGAQDYDVSRAFYRDLGLEEVVLGPKMCLFRADAIAFYLQDAYVKDWVDNTMVFVEVEDVAATYADLQARDLPGKYPSVRLVPVRVEAWGKECFLHDPSGILWHFGQFA